MLGRGFGLRRVKNTHRMWEWGVTESGLLGGRASTFRTTASLGPPPCGLNPSFSHRPAVHAPGGAATTATQTRPIPTPGLGLLQEPPPGRCANPWPLSHAQGGYTMCRARLCQSVTLCYPMAKLRLTGVRTLEIVLSWLVRLV